MSEIIGVSFEVSSGDNALQMLMLYEILENDQRVKRGLSNLVTPESYLFLLDTVRLVAPYIEEIARDGKDDHDEE